MAAKTLEEYLATRCEHDYQREGIMRVIEWVQEQYPQLELRIAWNQPMFTHHGTFIIGFSAARHHMAIAPERKTMVHFETIMNEGGTDRTKMFARQKWSEDFDYELLRAFIDFNIADKAGCETFWRRDEESKR